MSFIRVRNWDRYQHYKDRRPPWVKLYVDVLLDDTLLSCTVPSRLLALLILCVAANRDNRIPAEPVWIATEVGLPVPQVRKAIRELLDCGYIESASGTASKPPSGNAPSEAEAETETESAAAEADFSLGSNHEVTKLLAVLVGCDDKSEHVLRKYAAGLPESVVADIRERAQIRGDCGPGWAIQALKGERRKRAA